MALREKAAKCRRLAASMADDQTVAALLRLADSYERMANDLSSDPAGPAMIINPRMTD